MPTMEDAKAGRRQAPEGISPGHLAYSLYIRYYGKDQFPAWGDLTLAQRHHWECSAKAADGQRK